MSNIVERLRARKEFGLNGSMWMILPEPDRDCHEAADEIEKGYAAMRENSELRIEIERLRQDNHSLWGSLRNRMAADAARTLPR